MQTQQAKQPQNNATSTSLIPCSRNRKQRRRHYLLKISRKTLALSAFLICLLCVETAAASVGSEMETVSQPEDQLPV